MKVIDKTPLQDEQGNISIIARIQGTLKYGLNWYSELEAQKRVIAQLDRMLEKGYVMIRNFTLPESEIVIPLILIGPGSVSVILVSPVKGQFEAKGAEWNTVVNGVSSPAPRNLIDLIAKLTRAFQKYLQVSNINVPVQVEPVLIASDPGAQIESLRPMVRVVRSDAIKQFANALMQSRPVLRSDSISSIADAIIDPKSRPNLHFEEPAPEDKAVSRAQAIFNAGDSAPESIDANALGFEFNEEPNAANPAQPPANRPTPQKQPAVPANRKPRGLSRTQLILLVGMGVLECCVIVAAAAILFLNQ